MGTACSDLVVHSSHSVHVACGAPDGAPPRPPAFHGTDHAGTPDVGEHHAWEHQMNEHSAFFASALLLLSVSACATGLSPISPPCPDPAPLLGEPTEAPGYIVVYRDGTDASAVTAELAAKYEFTPRHVYEHALQGFTAELSGTVVAALRCEAVVKHVEYDRTFTVRWGGAWREPGGHGSRT
jgi:hypothetical protein